MRRIFLIILIVVLAWAAVWYFYVRPHEKTSTPIPAAVTSFFPKATTANDIDVLYGSKNSGLPGTGQSGQNNAPLREITSHPVAGYTIFSLTNQVSVPTIVTSKSGVKVPQVNVQSVTDHYIRYVSRDNGYVYEIKDDNNAVQITNVFVPNVYQAYFMDGNNTAILRFLQSDNETISTYSIPIAQPNPDGTRTQEPGTYLPDNITAVAISPDQGTILRIMNTKSGTVISTSKSDNTAQKSVTVSSFSSWLPQWNTNGIYLQSKAASVANGFLYQIDQKTGRLQHIIGDVPGMTTSVSPSGTYVLYSESTNGGFQTELFNTKTNATTSLALDILPEKCAWLQNENLICAGNTSVPQGTYPDDWYSGIMHFSDQIYEIYTASNSYTTLYDGSVQSFDMTDLQVDEGQQIVYFIDKNTGLLWSYKY